MITPAEAAGRFVPALVLGCMLGMVYGFLRPVRRGRGVVTDLVFLLFLLGAWMQLGFRFCRGDLRPAYTLTLLLSVYLWDRTVGRWLEPLFCGFWSGLEKLWKIIFAKCRKIRKFLFARRKK